MVVMAEPFPMRLTSSREHKMLSIRGKMDHFSMRNDTTQ